MPTKVLEIHMIIVYSDGTDVAEAESVLEHRDQIIENAHQQIKHEIITHISESKWCTLVTGIKDYEAHKIDESKC